MLSQNIHYPVYPYFIPSARLNYTVPQNYVFLLWKLKCLPAKGIQWNPALRQNSCKWRTVKEIFEVISISQRSFLSSFFYPKLYRRIRKKLWYMATWFFIWASLFLSMTSSPAANRPIYKWYWTKTEENGDFLQFSFKSSISALITGTIDLISIFYFKMSLISPIFLSTQVILTVPLQITNNLTTFSFMMELTLSSVSHTKMKLQFNLHNYTLSIATEEKN